MVGRVAGDRWARVRWEQFERAVWPVPVVVVAVDAEHVFEVAATDDQEVVEAVGANGAHPALGVGVPARCSV
jgi:hypothetical protein